LNKTEEGTPQGGIMSHMLSNLAFNGLEQAIRKEFPPTKKVSGSRPKIHIIRYADDLIVTGSSKHILNKVRHIIESFLKIRGPEFKTAKTRIVTIFTGFDFLGFNISRKKYNPRFNQLTGQKTVLIIKPSDKAVKAIKTRIRSIILGKRSEIQAIIKDINPLLRE